MRAASDRPWQMVTQHQIFFIKVPRAQVELSGLTSLITCSRNPNVGSSARCPTQNGQLVIRSRGPIVELDHHDRDAECRPQNGLEHSPHSHRWPWCRDRFQRPDG
jgi:hypothetical protein